MNSDDQQRANSGGVPSTRSPTASPVPSVAVGRGLVVVAALLWSSSGLFAKAPFFVGWPAAVLAFWRAAFACVILLPLVRRPQFSWQLVPALLTFAAMNYTYVKALVEGSPANAIWMQSTAPIWVLIVNAFVLKEAVNWRDWLLLICCLLGISLILVCEWRSLDSSHPFSAVLYGVASGVFYAGVVLSLRQLRRFDSAWLVGLNHLATALLLAPALVTSESWPNSAAQWGLLAAFGMLQMGLPYVLFARGLRALPSHEAAGIGLLEPLLMPLWVFVAWGIRPAWWTMVGGGLILCGLTVKYLAIGPRIAVSKVGGEA